MDYNASEPLSVPASSTGVLLLGVYTTSGEEAECDRSLSELASLVETALSEPEIRFFSMTQCRKAPEAATYIGEGKAREAAELCKNNDITLAVFDAELSPSQIKNLEELLNAPFVADEKNIRLIDRTMLILDIFAAHAVTGEGKLQVEIAQLKYTSPRLTGQGVSLSRQGGSAVVGSRGPGETKLETDRRHIRARIQALKEQLAVLEKERAVKRSKREKSGIPTIAIAGYTNAGKSTLLNYLTDAGILAENKLFATLDPTVRRLTLPSGREVLLADTVGFIHKLPHGLVEAFRSTLDEVRYADALLIVTDASDPEYELKLRVTEETLASLEAVGKPTLYVFNKADKVETRLPQELLLSRDAVNVSALTGEGIDDLLALVDDLLMRSKRRVCFLFPFDVQGAALSELYKNATVESVEYTDGGAKVTVLVDPKQLGRYQNYIWEEEA